MDDTILIPVAPADETDAAEAIAVARRLISESGRITRPGAIEQMPDHVAEYITLQPGPRIEHPVRARLEVIAVGNGGAGSIVTDGKPGVVIAEHAAATATESIVLRSHRPGARDYFLGSTASRVVRRAPCAVFVIR